MQLDNFNHFGGRAAPAGALKNLLAYAGIGNPLTGRPFSEAVCFGIAGGIGAGYSFCPSIIRYGCGSGVTIPGLHKAYSTDGAWYRGFCERLGIPARVTETAAKGKAYQNLLTELRDGRPAVVWCARHLLPFLGSPRDAHNCFMHSFIVFGVDEEKKIAHGADSAPTKITMTLEELAATRDGVCSHKNRTLSIQPGVVISKNKLASAVTEGLRACAKELLDGKIKTYSLHGLTQWANMIDNRKNKEGWLNVFKNGLLFNALRDAFLSIEVMYAGGGLYRPLFAEFLEEAAGVLGNKQLTILAGDYRALAEQWTELAENLLPSRIKPFKRTKDLLRKSARLQHGKGPKAAKEIGVMTEELRQLEKATRQDFPLPDDEVGTLAGKLKDRILAIHAAEVAAAERLRAVAG